MEYRKMTLVPTRNGNDTVYLYECFYCKEILKSDQADTHECGGNR